MKKDKDEIVLPQCKREGCTNTVKTVRYGMPAQFCSQACYKKTKAGRTWGHGNYA